MRKVLLMVVMMCLVVAIVAVAGGCKSNEHKEGMKTQAKCPVMGGNIDKKLYVEYKGKRIYFCCPGCDKEFLKDPDKYMKTMEGEGIKLENAPTAATPPAEAKPQTMCPVMNMPIDKKFYADYNGKRIYFCHDGCVAEFKKNPEKYMTVLQNWGVTPEPAPNP